MNGDLRGYLRRVLGTFRHPLGRASPKVLWTGTSTFGECPVWNERLERLFWLDIPSGVLRSFAPGRTWIDEWQIGSQSAGLTIDPRDGRMIAGNGGVLRHIDPATGSVSDLDVLPDGDVEERINDLAIDPRGDLWVASMDIAGRKPLGRLLRRSTDGRWTTMLTGMPIVNGPAFDARRGVGYVCDSNARRVLRFEIPTADSMPELETEFFITLQERDGFPDGITVDATSCLWVAHYGGSKVTRWTPDGTQVGVIAMPVSNPTSVAIGNGTLFITSAADGTGGGGSPGGALFGVPLEESGAAAAS